MSVNYYQWRQLKSHLFKSRINNRCSIEKFMELTLTLFFKRQHRKLSWLDKDSDKDQSQFDELFN
jgi:hypothetical protein